MKLIMSDQKNTLLYFLILFSTFLCAMQDHQLSEQPYSGRLDVESSILQKHATLDESFYKKRITDFIESSNLKTSTYLSAFLEILSSKIQKMDTITANPTHDLEPLIDKKGRWIKTFSNQLHLKPVKFIDKPELKELVHQYSMVVRDVWLAAVCRALGCHCKRMPKPDWYWNSQEVTLQEFQQRAQQSYSPAVVENISELFEETVCNRFVVAVLQSESNNSRAYSAKEQRPITLFKEGRLKWNF